MKKLLLVFVFLFCCSVAFAGTSISIICGSAGGAPACATAIDECGFDENGWLDIAHTASYKYVSTLFVKSGASAGVCKLDVLLRRTGSPAYTLTASIWSDDGSDKPSALMGTASDAVDISSVTTDAGGEWVTFEGTLDSGALSDATKYHVVLVASSIESTENNVEWAYDNDCGGANEEMNRSSDGSSWSAYLSSQTFEFKLYEE